MKNDDLDRVSQDDLFAAGIEDAPAAERLLQSLAGQGVTDDNLAPFVPELMNALSLSPDPDRALQCFTRWFQALASPSSHLKRILQAPQSLNTFCIVTGCSQYFGDLIARNPEYFAVVEEPKSGPGAHSAAHYYRQISLLMSVCQHAELKCDVLRRWKAREMLRIGVRDLTGIADMPTASREFSHLADSCVQAAYDIAANTLPLAPGEQAPGLAIIGMGKLGGVELNYCSDIDLMFVHADELPEEVELVGGRRVETSVYLTRLAENVIRVLADETSNGSVFRVDMRLRPEGKFGSLTRSLSSFDAYYESWAEGWEFQALLKARAIAGDRAAAGKFMELVEKYGYREYPSSRLLDELRQNKRRIEAKCEIEGETETNVKTGYGGIRDVEFIVQLLQLKYGYRHKRLRTTNTLTALNRLYRAHLLYESDVNQLTEGYTFLRNLEHRLQLLNGYQVQNLPDLSNSKERAKVALRMGYADSSHFEAELNRHRSQIHEALDRILYSSSAGNGQTQHEVNGAWNGLGSLLDNLNTPAARDRLSALLKEQGFHDIPSALSALELPMIGNQFGEMPPDTPEEFKRIAPDLMARAARSASPDAALAGVESIALAVPNRAQLYAAFSQSPDVLDRLVRLAAGSPPLVNRLSNHLEWLEAILSPDLRHDNGIPDSSAPQIATPVTPEPEFDRIVQEMRRRSERASGSEASIDAISSVFQREALLIGANEIWEDTDSTATMRGLTNLADATLEAMIELCSEAIAAESAAPETTRSVLGTVAVVGLGKLGGAELGYASDWDLLVVHQPPHIPACPTESECARIAEELVSRVTDAAQSLITRGANIEIDLRLRPWGRSGSIAPSMRSYIDYYRTSAETWERQAAIKARFVAGNSRNGARLVRILRAVSFGKKLTPAEESEVEAMKKRMELERLDPSERYTDVKLGYGGLTDIEWIAQRLQMKHGALYRSIRASNTIQAISAIAGCGLINNKEADILIETYILLVRVRNTLWLQLGRSKDTLPTNTGLLNTMARQLGYSVLNSNSAADRMVADITGHMRETRAIFERQFSRSIT